MSEDAVPAGCPQPGACRKDALVEAARALAYGEILEDEPLDWMEACPLCARAARGILRMKLLFAADADEGPAPGAMGMGEE